MDLTAGEANTVRYYATCWSPRLADGYNARSHAIHYGLDEDPRAGGRDAADEAKTRMNEHVAERLALGTGPASVVDLGCGVGGTTLWLASNRAGWRVTGVDIASESLALATRFAVALDVPARPRFVEARFSDTGLDAKFDGALAIESPCHAEDRRAFAAEALRLLRPGGHLVVNDLARTRQPLDDAARDAYAVLLEGFAVIDYYDVPLADVLGEVGFGDVDVEDLTPRVVGSLARSRARARAMRATDPVAARHLAACCAAADLVDSGHLAYWSVRGRRPIGASASR